MRGEKRVQTKGTSTKTTDHRSIQLDEHSLSQIGMIPRRCGRLTRLPAKFKEYVLPSKYLTLISQPKLARERGDAAYIKRHMLVVNEDSWTYEEIFENLRSNQSVLSSAASGSKKRGPEESPEKLEHRSKKALHKRSTRAASRSGQK
ncbi:hypothetical protein JTB14_031500 [Gonioctena quinquepunctata]|nr:hypothetical protein JTB14_031500 [Gonioctena quinquepunctata]